MKTRYMNSTAVAAFIKPRVFDPGKAGWKIDDKGAIVLKDGNPVYIDSNGTESTVDGGTISRLNGEARQHRIEKEAVMESLKAFKDIDPAAAKKAIADIAKIDQKKLIDAGEVDKVRKEITDQFTEQMAQVKKTNEELVATNHNMMRSNAFANSKFIKDRVAVPPEMFEATFGKNFKVEDNKIVPYGMDNNKVYSKKRMGEIADVDEALEIIIESYPHKDSILKAPGASGSGNGGGGGNRGTGATITRAEFSKLSPAAQSEQAMKAGKGEITIVD